MTLDNRLAFTFLLCYLMICYHTLSDFDKKLIDTICDNYWWWWLLYEFGLVDVTLLLISSYHTSCLYVHIFRVIKDLLDSYPLPWRMLLALSKRYVKCHSLCWTLYSRDYIVWFFCILDSKPRVSLLSFILGDLQWGGLSCYLPQFLWWYVHTNCLLLT